MHEHVSIFYTHLASLKERHGFLTTDIWVLHETGISTMQVPGKVIAPTGRKQMGERSPNVSVCAAVGGICNSVCPHCVLPCVNCMCCSRWYR